MDGILKPVRRVARQARWLVSVALALAALILAACGSDDGSGTTATPTTTATTSTPASTESPGATADAAPDALSDALAGVAGIVDSTNRGWPRAVEGTNGIVTIEAPPQHVHTTSVGLDEVVLGLIPASRVAGVGTSSQNPDYSNVAGVVAALPAVGRDPEEIAALQPDLVIAAPRQDADFVSALERVSIPVVQIELLETPEGRIETILLIGYLLGEEERAFALAEEVRGRYEALIAVTDAIPEADRPSVMYTSIYSDTITASGTGSTQEGITAAAGGRCGPCEAEMERTATISLESIIAVNPDVIVIPMVADAGEAYREMLLTAPALAEVPAIRDGRVHVLPLRLHNTLSYANVLAAEQLAAILWPGQFPDEYRDEPPPFSGAGG